MKPKIIVKPKVRAKSPIKLKLVNRFIYETDNCMGQCWPHTKKHIIEIDPRQSPKDYLDTIIHESLHELFPNKKESVINRSGTSIANLLWKLGYRKEKRKKK